MRGLFLADADDISVPPYVEQLSQADRLRRRSSIV
jgi:hypothetical protein